MAVELELPPGPPFEAVGRLVVGGLGARLGLGADRIVDFQHALHAALQHRPSGPTLVLTMYPTTEGLRVRLGPFDRRAGPISAAQRVGSALVDEITTYETGRDVWVDMHVNSRRNVTG
jgi:hypothetical protein